MQNTPATPPTALDEVLNWWASPENTPPDMQVLRNETKRIRRSKKRRAAVVQCAGRLLATQLPDAAAVAQIPLSPPFHRLLWNYAIADEIALRSQRKEQRSCRRLVVIVAVLGLGFLSLRIAPQLWPAASAEMLGFPLTKLAPLGVILFCLIASMLGQRHFSRQRGRFLIARTLAETLRVDLFQRVAGTNFDTATQFQRHHQLTREAPFTVRLLQKALACSDVAKAPPQPDGVELARKLWLQSQFDFFGDPTQIPPSATSATGKELQRNQRSETRFQWYLRFAIVFFLLSVAWKAVPGSMQSGWGLLLGISTEAGAGVFGLLAGFYRQMAALHAVTGQKYHRAGLYLSEALHRMDSLQEGPERVALLREVAREAVAENADWGVHQRHHTPRTSFR